MCEVEVSDNPYDYTRLAVSDAPVIVALTQVKMHAWGWGRLGGGGRAWQDVECVEDCCETSVGQ